MLDFIPNPIGLTGQKTVMAIDTATDTTSDRLETAVRNFQHVNQMVERYTRLCRAYVSLSESFHQLDVEHMTLKEQVVPLLKAFQAQQVKIKAAKTENTRLQSLLTQQQAHFQSALDQQDALHRQELQQLTTTYEEKLQTISSHLAELQPLEQLLSADIHQELSVAEAQMDLVETTLQEMADDSSPDLSGEEKTLLAAYQADPAAFLVAAADTPVGANVSSEEPVASLWHYYYDEQVPDGFAQ